MQEIPKRLLEWSELIPPIGERVLKESAPEEIKKEAVDFERAFYKKTSRRMFTNIDIETA